MRRTHARRPAPPRPPQRLSLAERLGEDFELYTGRGEDETEFRWLLDDCAKRSDAHAGHDPWQ